MTQASIQLKIRIPRDAKAFIEAEAQSNACSQSSEIVRCIRERMQKFGPVEAVTSPSHDHTQPSKGKSNEQS
jgi:hypothetical protein